MKLRLGDRAKVDPRWRWGSTALLSDSNCDLTLQMLADNSQCNKHVSCADFENRCDVNN